MIPDPLHSTSHRNLRPTGIGLALLMLLGGIAYLPAQPGDTPIVIGDGSLTMQSAVPWSSYAGTGTAHSHPQVAKSVTSVEVTMPALDHTIPFKGEQAEVTIVYAGTFTIRLATSPNGKKLVVNTDFGSFRQGGDANHLVHTNATGSISHVTVTRNGAVAFDSAASGHTKVVIHYQ